MAMASAGVRDGANGPPPPPTPANAADDGAPYGLSAGRGSDAGPRHVLESEPEGSIWARTERDQLAGVRTSTPLMTFVDVDRSGTSKLVLVDHVKPPASVDGSAADAPQSEIRVWSRRQQVQSRTVPGCPSAVAAFNVTASEGGGAAVAVGSGDTVFVYVNLRAYAKFSTPPAPLLDAERRVWETLASAPPGAPIDADGAAVELAAAAERDLTTPLSPRSLRLLSLATAGERAAFVEEHRSAPLRPRQAVTALAALHQNATAEGSPQCVVVGTELGGVHVVNPGTYEVVESFRVPSTVAQIGTQGSHQVEFRLLVTCRDGRIYRLKGGDPKPIGIELPSIAVGVARVHKHQYVGCADATLSCYSGRGKRQWTVQLPSPVVAVTLLSYRPRNLKAVVVALQSGEVRTYVDRVVVDTFSLHEPAAGLAFGPYDGSEGVLVVATASGRLVFKYIKPAVDVTGLGVQGGPPPEQSVRIPVPSTTQLYVDNTRREQSAATAMHRTFQRDLFRLKLLSARHYARALQSHKSPVATSVRVSLRAGIEVLGMGPAFRVVVTVVNATDRAVDGIRLMLTADPAVYRLAHADAALGLLVPGAPYRHAAVATCVAEGPVAAPVGVQVFRAGEAAPVVTASVDMPIVNAIEV